MRGDKPTPTAIRKLHGAQKSLLPKNEPKPKLVTEDFPPPSHLGIEAQKEWRQKIPGLRAMGMLSTVDLTLLETWCSASGDFRVAELEIKKNGMVIKDDHGNLRRSPWTILKSKATQELKGLASEFGFSPAARPRLGREIEAAPKAPRATGSDNKDDAPQTLREFLETKDTKGEAVH
jgi:P27 family predicted phage terminase small subunit